MEKAYNRIKWENYPSVATPLNEVNLNKMDASLDEVDNRVLGLDTAKLDKAIANTMIKDISFAEDTGIFTITLLDGTTKTIDTKLEKIATNFSYDYEAQKLILTLSDGTQQEIDLSSLISQFEFVDSDTIDITVDSSGKVSAIVKDGSITENKLQPNFLADVKIEVAKAKSSSDSSYENATTARESATAAEQFRNEAEQFRNQAEAMSGINIATTEIAGIVKPDGTTIRVDPDGTIHADSGTVNYNDLENKPKINGVEITGELTTEDLNIDLGTGDYEELENKPKINGVELSGNKTLDVLGIASAEKVEEIETELQETTSKVNIIIENADLGFKETASGENIHLDDSADSKLVELGLHGKATQNGIPTPENPVEIEVAGSDGSVEVKSVGKNLLIYPYHETTHTDNGIVWTDNVDGTVTANGTATALSSFLCKVRISPNGLMLGNGTYILSGCPSGGSESTYLIGANVTVNGVNNKLGIDTGNGNTITVNGDDYYTDKANVGIYLEIKVGTTVSNLTFKPMIRLATDTDNTWEPYKGKTATIPTENGLAGIKVVSNGNYTDQNGQQWICDEVVKYADGSGAYIQRIGKSVFDGSTDEGWVVANTNDTAKKRMQTRSLRNYIKKVEISAIFNGMSNIAISNSSNNTWRCFAGVSTDTAGDIFVYSENYNTDDVSLWTSYLAENPMALYYELAEPITTPLTAEQLAEIEKLYTFYPVTNISNDADCGMKIKYIADAKRYIDNRLALIEQAMLNSI